MRCPKCGFLEDKVVDSRSIRAGDAVRRRRVCLKCGARFTTYEEVVKAHLRVIKNDGRHEDFDRAKLLGGLRRAFEKRPINDQDIERLADEIMLELESEFEREAPTAVIGEKVMRRLHKLDDVAYVRFASVYRRFRQADDFVSEVKNLAERS